MHCLHEESMYLLRTEGAFELKCIIGESKCKFKDCFIICRQASAVTDTGSSDSDSTHLNWFCK